MSHDHHPITSTHNKAFAIGVALNLIFVLIEFIYGMKADSLALISDAGHNLSDVAGLLLAWGAVILAKRPATKHRTYGFSKATVFASLISSILLVIALGAITTEAMERFQDPQPIHGPTVIIVASIGILINTLTALLFMRGQKNDLNIRGAFLHMAADALVSAGVVVGTIVMMYTQWLWIDPVLSLIIVVVILAATWNLLRDSAYYLLDFVPSTINNNEVEQYFTNIAGVDSFHDLHIWPLSTTQTALTVHLVINSHNIDNALLAQIQNQLKTQFNIEHSTIQIESCLQPEQCAQNNRH